MEQVKSIKGIRCYSKKGNKYYKYLFVCTHCKTAVWREWSNGSSYSSCGCMAYEGGDRTTHGESMKRTALYSIWGRLKSQCDNKNDRAYMFHGGRGRRLYYEWADYIVFRDWAMKNGYEKGKKLNLKYINGDYAPDNCEWTNKNNAVSVRWKRHEVIK